jgi:hypothetical protein
VNTERSFNFGVVRLKIFGCHAIVFIGHC